MSVGHPLRMRIDVHWAGAALPNRLRPVVFPFVVPLRIDSRQLPKSRSHKS